MALSQLKQNFIPNKDPEFAIWFDRYAVAVAALTPPAFGVTADMATAIGDANTAWNTAYLLATDPVTRTSITIENKNYEKKLALETIRQVSKGVEGFILNDNVDNPGNRTDNVKFMASLGLTLPSGKRSVRFAPSFPPGLSVRSAGNARINVSYFNERPSAQGQHGLSSRSSKPLGVTHIELMMWIAGTAPITLSLKKATTSVQLPYNWGGHDMYLQAKYVGNHGSESPWCPVVEFTPSATGIAYSSQALTVPVQ